MFDKFSLRLPGRSHGIEQSFDRLKNLSWLFVHTKPFNFSRSVHTKLWTNRRRLPVDRVIFVWPWNENALTKQKQQTNGNRAILLVYRTDTNARGFWLVKRTLGWKKLHARELSRNQSILRFDVILQHDWPIGQCLLHTLEPPVSDHSKCKDLKWSLTRIEPQGASSMKWSGHIYFMEDNLLYTMSKLRHV